MLSYGIKEKTGIDLPNETGGLISNIINVTRDFEYANAAFWTRYCFDSHGDDTSIGIIIKWRKTSGTAYCAKNKIQQWYGKNITYQTTPTKISETTGTEITRMLVNAMDKNLGASEKLERYSVAAKTGTAQVADNTNGGYYEDRYTHSFMDIFLLMILNS